MLILSVFPNPTFGLLESFFRSARIILSKDVTPGVGCDHLPGFSKAYDEKEARG